MRRKGDKTKDKLERELLNNYKSTREKIIMDIQHLIYQYQHNKDKHTEHDFRMLIKFIDNKRNKLFKIIYSLYTQYGISRELKIPVYAVYKGYKHRRFHIESVVFIEEESAVKLMFELDEGKSIQDMKDGVIYAVKRILVPIDKVRELQIILTKFDYVWDA